MNKKAVGAGRIALVLNVILVAVAATMITALIYSGLRLRSSPSTVTPNAAPAVGAATQLQSPARVSLDPVYFGEDGKPRPGQSDLSCDEIKARAPAVPKPGAAQQQALKSCRAFDLYYGIHGRRDVEAARLCALAKLKGDDEQVSAGVLMMIYANGEGVPPDYDYAAAMACRAGHSRADVSDRLQDIDNRRAGSSKPAEFCENTSSGALAGLCADNEARRLDRERDRRLAALQSGWSKPARAAWSAAAARRIRFEDDRVDHELDRSGTLRSALADVAVQDIRTFDETLVNTLMAGQMIRAKSDLARHSSRSVEDVFRRLKAEQAPDPDASQDIEISQIAWRQYRDRWRRFAEIIRPGSGDGVVIALADERRAMLECYLKDRPDGLVCRADMGGNIPRPKRIPTRRGDRPPR